MCRRGSQLFALLCLGLALATPVVADGSAAATATTTAVDADGDGLTDEREREVFDTDPERADTDGDGLSDGAEVEQYGTNPAVADTDGDGVSDGEEVERGSDPQAAESGDATTARQDSEGGSEASDGATPVRDHANDGVGFFAAMTYVQFAAVFLLGSLAGGSVIYLLRRS